MKERLIQHSWDILNKVFFGIENISLFLFLKQHWSVRSVYKIITRICTLCAQSTKGSHQRLHNRFYLIHTIKWHTVISMIGELEWCVKAQAFCSFIFLLPYSFSVCVWGEGQNSSNYSSRNLKSAFILPFSINSIDLLPSNYLANLSTSFQYIWATIIFYLDSSNR